MSAKDIYSTYLNKSDVQITSAVQAAVGEPYELALVGGQLVMPDAGIVRANIYTRHGRICALSEDVHPAQRTLDVTGKHVLPGIVDPHTHLGITGDFRGDLESETLSAIIGGVTSIGCFIAAPGATIAGFAPLMRDVAQVSHVDVTPHYVIGSPDQFAEIPDMVKGLGLRSFKVYMHGVPGLIPSQDDGFIVEAMECLKQTGEECVLFLHCENHALVERATRLAEAKYGPGATLEQYESAHPAMAEEEAVMRVAYFAEKIKQAVYLVHISSGEAAQRIRRIKQENSYVYAETTSPYLSAKASDFHNTAGLMIPPLRTEHDITRLWQALRDGDIDTIGTDNTTLSLQEKGDAHNVWKAFPGYPALGTHLTSLLHEANMRGVPLLTVVRAITKRPAEILGIYPRKGALLPGSDADITVVDLNLIKTVEPANLYSRSDFALHQGRALRGWPILTIKSGVVVAQNGQPTGEKPGAQIVVGDRG